MHINVYYLILLMITTAGIFYTLPKQHWMIQLLVFFGWISGLIYLLILLIPPSAKVFIEFTQQV